MPKIDIGLTDKQRSSVIEILNSDLADSYLLLVKTKKYHWDVVGSQFRTLHQLWEEHYEALTMNIDAIAERIRALGGYPVGTMKQFLDLATLKEHGDNIPLATEMVSQLQQDHEQIVRNLRKHIDQCSDDYHDEGTADFLTGLMEQHEKIAWMLRSFLDGEAVESNTHKSESNKKQKVLA